tara:strand:- start:4515 stop:4850 length:336 start_codon:yes stop_codon:yes gene_type:complete
MSEDRLQIDCYMWFHNKYPNLRGLLFHVPNGGSRSKREGAKFKAMGVYPGVSDFLFIYDNKLYCIELKIQKGKQSKVQKKWEDTVLNEGCIYNIVRSQSEFEVLIESILKN